MRIRLAILALLFCHAASRAEDPLAWTPPAELPFKEYFNDTDYHKQCAAARQKINDWIDRHKEYPEFGDRVKSVVEGSPAEKLKIVAGDIFVSLDGKPYSQSGDVNVTKLKQPARLAWFSPPS